MGPRHSVASEDQRGQIGGVDVVALPCAAPPPKLEARLYSLEARLADEMDARHPMSRQLSARDQCKYVMCSSIPFL